MTYLFLGLTDHTVRTMPFSAIPLEVKQAIWQLALPDDEPEVCIIWPLNQNTFDQAAEPLLVDTAFPMLMHVCREWRDFVLSSTSGVRFRSSRQADCRVPYRLFRGSMDVLYACTTNFEMAVQCLAVDWEPGVKKHTLATVRHLAVEWVVWKRAAYWLPELVFRGCPDLQKVSVVFPSSRRAMWNAFQAPARRCKLRRVENPHELLAEREGRPEEMVSVQWQVDYGRDVAEDQAVFTWQNELDVHEMDMDEPGGEWFAGSAWDKEQEKLCLDYEAAAFVEYKRLDDGRESWVEACEDRLLVHGEDGVFQEPPIPSLEQRGRNPEQWRVNDEDDYQV